MCYDISFTVKMRKLSDYFPGLIFDAQLDFDFGPIDHIQGPSIFPAHPIIFENQTDRQLHCRMMEWGIIPHDTDENVNIDTEAFKLQRNKWLNIRSERVQDDRSSYWYKIRNRRGLIPVTATFEYRAIKGRSRKVPYCISPFNQKVFFLPGLYAVWRRYDFKNKTTIDVPTFGQMTTDANEVMKDIHNDGDNPYRMPLYLPLDLAREFVSNDLQLDHYREILNYKIPSQDLIYHPVYPIRGTIRPDGKEKHEFFDYGNLPALGTMNPDKPQDTMTLFG